MREVLRKALDTAVSASLSPGAVALVGDVHHTYFHAATGLRQAVPEPLPALPTTPYDLASLTKVVATTTAIMLLREDGALDLDQPVSEIVPIPAFGAFTVRHLLTHTAGLVAGLPYYKTASSIDEMLQRYAEREPDWPPGTRRRYSDVGFMILGRAVELAARDSLDAFCAKRIFKPLGMKCTAFNPPKAWRDTCAATEDCAWRGRLLVGEVHDENAYAVGGVSGHAGLFAPAEDLALFCRASLSGKLLPEKVLDEMTRLGQAPVYPWQGLGWQLDPWASGKEGFLPSRSAFGHTGWTGTCIWMDRRTGLFGILLSNTCHPSRANRNNEILRRTFFSAVARQFYPRTTNAHSGLDRVVWEGFAMVRDKRFALLTNHAAVDQLGRHILDVFALDPRVKPTRLYSPEHGIRGDVEAGEAVASEPGDVPIISLYGERKRPSRDELKNVDLFVIDLQDVGARYYTYAATMFDCIRACGETRTPVLVLDRPNPVGGDTLEGPIATDVGSPVCAAPVPIRHGMTMGELATCFVDTLLTGPKPSLSVSALDGWQPERLFDECGLPWTPPSPNVPKARTALLYTGTCLFEGTNLNEGRGADTPFEMIGAPWLDPAAVIRKIRAADRPGCSLVPVTYTPRAIPGKASDPRYRDQECQGIRIVVQDPHKVRAFTLAVALLIAIRNRHSGEFQWEPSFDVLAGSKDLRCAIETGKSARRIIAECASALDAFNTKRVRQYASW